MDFQGALQLPCAVILLGLSVDVNVWLAYSRRSGRGCSGKGHTAENHGRSRRVIQERLVHRQEPKIPLFVPFFWGVFRYVGRGATVASERHRPSQKFGVLPPGNTSYSPSRPGRQGLHRSHRMSMHLRGRSHPMESSDLRRQLGSTFPTTACVGSFRTRPGLRPQPRGHLQFRLELPLVVL